MGAGVVTRPAASSVSRVSYAISVGYRADHQCRRGPNGGLPVVLICKVRPLGTAVATLDLILGLMQISSLTGEPLQRSLGRAECRPWQSLYRAMGPSTPITACAGGA